MTLDYQCVTEVAVASSRLMKVRQYVTAETFMMGFVPDRRLQNSAGGHATWSCRCACGTLLWQNHYIKGTLCHVKCHWGNVTQAWPNTEIHDMSGEHLPITASFIVRWCSTAELTPLRYVRPSYRFLRPRSRENLSPAGTSHFPRPWVGHVRRTAPPDRFPKVLSIWI